MSNIYIHIHIHEHRYYYQHTFEILRSKLIPLKNKNKTRVFIFYLQIFVCSQKQCAMIFVTYWHCRYMENNQKYLYGTYLRLKIKISYVYRIDVYITLCGLYIVISFNLVYQKNKKLDHTSNKKKKLMFSPYIFLENLCDI